MPRGSLREYHARRDFARTAEPKGAVGKQKTSKLRYLIQKHAARALHYDFRLEWNGVLSACSVGNKLSNALFMSVTSRTAGFNSIDYAQATDAANFLTILLMMVGGSPGSTAGGIKTTTFALLGLMAWSRLRSRTSVTFSNRSIPEETVQRAVGLVVVATAAVVMGILLLSSIGDVLRTRDAFLSRTFEVVSAFNTVGLSMGVTADLSDPSRWLIILLMFVGRVGPLSLAAILRLRLAQRGKFRLAHEDVIVG